MSVRRKGREIALLLLYALDHVPSFEHEYALDDLWAIFDDPSVWQAFFQREPSQSHPLEEPPLWSLFRTLTLRPENRSSPPPSSQAKVAKDFALERVKGILENLKILDAAISEASRGWRIQRMAVIDRNILRLGTYEVLHCLDVPFPVIINEAVELSKRFSSKEARSFINGVLDKIVQIHGPKRPALPPSASTADA